MRDQLLQKSFMITKTRAICARSYWCMQADKNALTVAIVKDHYYKRPGNIHRGA